MATVQRLRNPFVKRRSAGVVCLKGYIGGGFKVIYFYFYITQTFPCNMQLIFKS